MVATNVNGRGPMKWGTLMVLSLALAIIIIDSTLLNVSLSTLVRELHTNLQSLQWVISAYALMLAALTVTGGRMGDLFGRKRMFQLGAIIFAAGSFVASISRNVPVLLIGESIIEGIGAALMMPATASLLVAKYRGHDRALAFGIWGAVAAAASAIGPILGGFLTTHFTWRWGFRINLVVAAILLIGSRIVDDPHDRENKRIDWIGVLLSAAGLFCVVFGIIRSENFGSRAIALIAIAIGAVILAGFAFWERSLESRGGLPIVSMQLFKNRHFVSGASVVGVLMLAQNGVIFSLPVFLQSVKQLDAFHTGLTLLPMSLTLLIVSPLAARLTKRIPHKRLVQTGLIINAIAIVILRFSIGTDVRLTWLIPGLALYGVGLGLVLSQINNLTLSSVNVREAGEASGVLNTFRQIGISLGSAIIGAILISTILVRLDAAVAESATIPPQSKQTVTRLLRDQATGVAFGESNVFDSLPPEPRSEMIAMRRGATTIGIQRALWFGAAFALLGLAVSVSLPLRANQESR